MRKLHQVITRFQVVFLEDASDFLDNIEERARRKIIFTITKAQKTQDKSLFKKLNFEIWEFRTLYGGTNYRLFSFWDKSDKQETLVIATHGMVKKSTAIPGRELKRAIEIRRTYFATKKY